MYRVSRILLMGAGFILAAGAALVFGFADCRLDGTVYMAVCLLGLAMMYGSSRGMSREY
ncbi:hypothetical protein [Lachnoclostridium sp. An118]|uniref:hypothetical protein n=1 Tax=Lachnoclostridium sp. An118 TaxID=1965547 RepID=UPI0013A60E8F|nr:hypothetical protein [Lachnoclostridium sp. An118]HJA43208.1 hypothetical protein [Candidatus Dorea stercoravium]